MKIIYRSLRVYNKLYGGCPRYKEVLVNIKTQLKLNAIKKFEHQTNLFLLYKCEVSFTKSIITEILIEDFLSTEF